MSSWVGFLRGINVGGHRKLPMADLRELHANLGHTNVVTYIASGNVVFGAEGKAKTIAEDLTSAIQDRFGYDVPVVVLPKKDLNQIADSSPFTPPEIDPKKIGIAFTHGKIPAAAKKVPTDHFGANDRMVVGDGAVYLHYPNGMSESKMSAGSLEALLGVPCTVRNWNTTVKMVDLLAGHQP